MARRARSAASPSDGVEDILAAPFSGGWRSLRRVPAGARKIRAISLKMSRSAFHFTRRTNWSNLGPNSLTAWNHQTRMTGSPRL